MEIRGIGINLAPSLPVSGVKPVQSTVAQEASTATSGEREIHSDSVSLSFINSVQGNTKENPRIQQIKEQIGNGTYKIPSGAAILDRVPLDKILLL